jgi:hypothetical protein
MNPFIFAWDVLKQDYPEDPTANAINMFEQVQAAKLARQQQMMQGGLNPMTGAPQQQAQTSYPPGAMQPPKQGAQPRVCPTCGGSGQI